MNLTPWRSRSSSSSMAPSITGLQSEINRMFDDFFNVPTWGRMAESSYPAIDVKETDNSIVVTAELPGIESKDVMINVRDNVLTIKGEKRAEKREEKDNYHYVERSYGSFARQIALPSEVDSDKAEAKMDKGVLSLTLPKRHDGGGKTISVKAS